MRFFWLIVFAVLFSVGALAWWGLGTVLDGKRRQEARSALVLFDVLSVVCLLVVGEFVWIPEPVRKYGMIFLSGIWMAELFFGIFALLTYAVRRPFCRGERDTTHAPNDIARRNFLAMALALPSLAAAFYGTSVERVRTVVREFDVPVSGLGDAVDGFRIAQLSDIHLGLFFSLDDLGALMKAAAATRADALVITGDLFDDDDMNREAAALIDTFYERFSHGIWFCYGNHEYFRNIARTKEALGRTRIHVLANDSARIVNDTRPLYFCGVDYPRKRDRFLELEMNFMKEAVRAVPKNAVTVLLAHHPDFIDDAAAHNVTLALTGHTHGGQLGCFGRPLVPPVFKYLRGKYIVGKCFGYVHSGNGSWFPFRLGCPPEIPVFTFTSKDAKQSFSELEV